MTTATVRTERRLAAILAADVVGYSRLIERDEAGTLAAIRDLRRAVIDPLLAEHQGRIVKLMGDGLIVEFGSVVDAVTCAVAVQERVARHQAARPPERQIVFRIGVNLGDVVIEGDGDLLGDGVNVAARLEQLCEPGGVAVSGTVYDHLQGKIEQPLDFAGEHRLKNIARPVRVYRLRTDHLTAGRRPWAVRHFPRRFGIVTALAALSVLLAGGALVLLPGAPGQKLWPALAGMLGLPAGGDPRLGPSSIVVLPFDTRGGGPEHERLADGLTEDIITDLARYPDLAVIARNTAFTYKDRPVRMLDLSRELGVRYALEGSLQVAGDRVRVTAQLVDARDDRHLWAERFDRPLEDVFALQDELTRTIVHRVAGWRGELAAARNEVARRKPPESLEVYDLYRLTVELTDGLTKERFVEAEPIIKRALELDPTFARAWWQLALIHQGYAAFGWAGDPAPHMAAYADAIKRALALDPHDPLIQVVAATAYIQENELERGLAAFERALALGPNNAEVLAYLAYFRPTKRSLRLAREDVEIARRALRLDPNPPPWFFGALGYACYYAGLYEEAIEALQRMPSEISDKHLNLTLSYAQLGRKEEAARARAALLELIPHFSAQAIVKGDNMQSEAAEHFLDGARKAGLPP